MVEETTEEESLPSLHHTAEWCLTTLKNLEEALSDAVEPDKDIFEVGVTLTLNAGHLMNALYTLVDLLEETELVEDIEGLSNFVDAGYEFRSVEGFNSSVVH
jgi:hypothetical protein